MSQAQYNGQKELERSKGTNIPGITSIGIMAEAERLKDRVEKTKQTKGMFICKPQKQWIDEAKQRAIPQMLFDEFWFEKELSFLFADTGAGKTILAIQIADAITTGKGTTIFKMEVTRQKVLYLDFELSDKQIEARYSSNFANHYPFSDNLYRIEIAPEMELPDGMTFETYLYYSLELALKDTGAKNLIVDNITYLKDEMERAKNALPLMKLLKALQRKYDLSILCLAHTPKRDLSKPLTRNDLAGSKMLINFCDSAFAIGESVKDSRIRYIKQIKVRQKAFKYDAENVIVCGVEKPENFLKFEFIDFGLEKDHLKIYTDADKEDLIKEVKKLSEEGKSQREISKKMKISVGAVNKYIKM